VADLGLFCIGLGILAPLAAIQHYILDYYCSHSYAVSALAGMNVARFLAGFGFPLFADVMYGSIGLGWGNSPSTENHDFFRERMTLPYPNLFRSGPGLQLCR
jgi:hypothetical protein